MGPTAVLTCSCRGSAAAKPFSAAAEQHPQSLSLTAARVAGGQGSTGLHSFLVLLTAHVSCTCAPHCQGPSPSHSCAGCSQHCQLVAHVCCASRPSGEAGDGVQGCAPARFLSLLCLCCQHSSAVAPLGGCSPCVSFTLEGSQPQTWCAHRVCGCCLGGSAQAA